MKKEKTNPVRKHRDTNPAFSQNNYLSRPSASEASGTKKLVNKIKELGKSIGKEVNLMEVCGTHTQTVSRYGIRSLMPGNVKLTTGPGCPVCIIPQKDIDAAVNLALAGIPIATYGDVLRVPGRFGSLENAREKGAEVRMVYSTKEALRLKKQLPDLVFFAIGFETTAPMTAFAVKKGLTIFSGHKLFIPAMKALVQSDDIKIDGFINPGHVSTITGLKPYSSLKVPQVISGFEPEDVLVAIYMLLRQIKEGRAEVENEYIRSVKEEGNPRAYQAMLDVFNVKNGNWRGFGEIPHSGLKLKKQYRNLDAENKHKNILSKVDFSISEKPTACRCGEIIKGLIPPGQCPLFKKVCSPEKPQGPCMVSVEGACSVKYKFGN